MSDENCVVCNDWAIGNCENCGVPICPDCNSGAYEDVYVCSDTAACSKRISESVAQKAGE